jgi:hypothetical protein
MSQRPLPTPKDDTDRWVLETVERDGWAVLAIKEEDYHPGYAFSVGLFRNFGHPELLIMGIPPESATRLINLMGEAIRSGQQFEASRRYDGFAQDFPLTFLAVDGRHHEPYLGYANWFNRGTDYPVLQCIWPDKQGQFPWEAGYEPAFFLAQRLLGPCPSFPDGWLFPDPPDAVTVTARQIIHANDPIRLVVREAAGSEVGWQFLTGGVCKAEDMMLVALGEVVKIDPAVGELNDLPPGWQARREEVGEPWHREPRQGSEA